MPDYAHDELEEQVSELEQQIEELTADRNRLQTLLDESNTRITEAQDDTIRLARDLGARI